jgi:hypothetical protein
MMLGMNIEGGDETRIDKRDDDPPFLKTFIHQGKIFADFSNTGGSYDCHVGVVLLQNLP